MFVNDSLPAAGVLRLVHRDSTSWGSVHSKSNQDLLRDILIDSDLLSDSVHAVPYRFSEEEW
jgi:hypothetical protein